jgi:hypothetical protein
MSTPPIDPTGADIQFAPQGPADIAVDSPPSPGLFGPTPTAQSIMGADVDPVLAQEGQGTKSVTDARQQQKIAALQAMMQGGGGGGQLPIPGVQPTPRIWRQT